MSDVDMVNMPEHKMIDLPDEILILVMSFLDFDSLLDAIYVNRHFRALAEPFIYESITVLHGEKALNLSHSFAKDRQRAEWVRSLLISTKFGQEHALMRLPPSICQMHNLRELRLETPDCNSKKPEDRVFWITLQDYYENIFRQSSLFVSQRIRLLPHLKTCVIHFVDTHTELYSLSKYSSIFLHPTLETLTISCMSTDRPEALFKDIPDIDQYKRSTALSELHLEECDIEPSCLELLLSLPKALKSLKISEGVRYDGMFRAGSRRMHGNVKPHLFAQALTKTCRESLESLSLALGYVRPHGSEINHTGQYLKLNELYNLKHLEVNNRTLNLIRSRPNCDHLLWKRLPSSTETLKVFSIPLIPPQQDTRQPYIPLLPCVIREKQLHGLPNLKTVTYSYEHYESTDDEQMNFNDLLMNLVYNEANGNPPAQPNNFNDGGHLNPFLNLIQQAVGAVNPPLPPPPPQQPVPTNFITAAMNPNLDQPPQHIQPPRFRWRTGPPALQQRPSVELSRSDAAKLALLNTIHESILSHFEQSKTRLEIDIITLPRGYIPPYLFPEDKPQIHKAWFNSEDPLSPMVFLNDIRQQREAIRMHMRDLRRSNYREIGENIELNRDLRSRLQNERDRSRSRFMRRQQTTQVNIHNGIAVATTVTAARNNDLDHGADDNDTTDDESVDDDNIESDDAATTEDDDDDDDEDEDDETSDPNYVEDTIFNDDQSTTDDEDADSALDPDDALDLLMHEALQDVAENLELENVELVLRVGDIINAGGVGLTGDIDEEDTGNSSGEESMNSVYVDAGTEIEMSDADDGELMEHCSSADNSMDGNCNYNDESNGSSSNNAGDEQFEYS